MIGLNCGSGQRPFDVSLGWVNIDIQDKWNPDYVADWNDLGFIEPNKVDYVVSHHSLEHVGCGEGDGFIQEAKRVLKPGGSLLIFVPDMRALAQRWLLRQMDTQLFMTNVYGAFHGDEADRHKWGYDRESLCRYLKRFEFQDVHAFNWRTIPGAEVSKDWWILGMEAIK